MKNTGQRKKKLLRLIYQRLFKVFGPQHWWPGDSPFEVSIGAILTQNTAWTNVEKAISNIKRENLLNPRNLHDISMQKLKELIRPAGFFNQKAIYLKEWLNFLSQYDYSFKKLDYEE